jgi:mRNA interferase RelE/StbE
VANYSVVIKSSAQKELDALDDAVFRRIDRKILALAENPRPAGCRSSKAIKTSGACESGTGVLSTSLTISAERVSITRVAHRREVYNG